MNVTYRTVVMHLPPTPLGLLGERWAIEHWCNTCRQRVDTDELVAHAHRHHDPRGTNDDLPIAAQLMHNDRPDRRGTPNNTAPALPASTTDTHQQRR